MSVEILAPVAEAGADINVTLDIGAPLTNGFYWFLHDFYLIWYLNFLVSAL